MTPSRRASDSPVTAWGRTVTADTSPPRIEDSAPAPEGEPSLLGGDFETFFNPFESRKVRAAVIDLQSRECKESWSIADRAIVAEDRSERGWNTASPGFAKVVEQLSETAIGEVSVKQVGLQRCLYFWRIEPEQIMVAEVSSLGRLPVSDVEPALVKEICSAAMKVHQTAALRAREAASAVSPSVSVDVPSRSARLLWVRAGWTCAVALLVCAAFGGWLFTKTSLEILHVRTLMDAAVLRSLSLALAKSDYAEVQEMLSTYGDSGYFSQAAVSNAKQRVIAITGKWSNVQIGEPVPDQIARAAETFDLRVGTESFGQLLIPQARTTPPRLVRSGLQSLRVASAWLSGLALVAGLTLCAYLLRMSFLAKSQRSERDAVVQERDEAVESKKE
jgi:hypothetical protein